MDADAPAGGDGLSWATAYRELRDALADPTPTLAREVWVAEGTYTPAPAGSTASTSFSLQYGDALYGGFAGTETDVAQRDARAHPTILSGDIDQDDDPVDPGGFDNVSPVVFAGRDVSFVLDGFVVRNGSRPTGDNGGGLGVHNGGDVRVANCRFEDNLAALGGGAFFDCASLVVASCSFVGNRCWAETTGGTGGGMYVVTGDTAQIANCEFVGNTARWAGAAVHLNEIGNPARIDDCTFFRNASDESLNGGLFTWGTSLVPVSNCIFWGNLGTYGTTEQHQLHAGSSQGRFEVSHSCIQGLDVHQGHGNIGLDPRFVDRVGADGIPGTADDDLRLSFVSPCVDAGRNADLPQDEADLDRDGNLAEELPVDLRLLPRRVDDPSVPDTGSGAVPLVDMGAHERQVP